MGADDISPSRGEYTCVARSQLNCRVIPEKRVFFDDMILRQIEDPLMHGKEIASILGEFKLVEHFPWERPTTDLHLLVPQEEFPCRIGIVGPDGRVVIRLVPFGTTVREVNNDLSIPRGFRTFWFRFVMHGPSLNQLVLDRKQPLSSNSFFPNILNNALTICYIVPEAESYVFLYEKIAPHSMDLRHGPGLPMHVLPATGGIDDLRYEALEKLRPYANVPLDHWSVVVQATYIPTEGDGPIYAEYYVRNTSPSNTNPEMNDIFVNEDASMASIARFVRNRSKYVQACQRMERDTTSMQFNKSHLSSSANKTRYKLLVNDNGRLGLEYYIPKNAGNSRDANVHVCSMNEFADSLITPAMLYETETHMFERIGLFRGKYLVFDAMQNSFPSHLDETEAPSDIREYVWNDDTLYTYQKESVEAMIVHERMPDGLVGLYLSRMSGSPGQPGLFCDSSRRVWYIEQGFDHMAGMMCDDIGMGKTRQMVALVRHTRRTMETATLIIVPPTILQQWITEIKSVWPDVRLLVMYGRSRTGVNLERDMTEHDIAITTYSTFLRYEDEFTGPQPWDRVVFDESHMIPRSFTSVHLPRKKVWFVTATPDINYRRMMAMVLTGCDGILPNVGTIGHKLEHTNMAMLKEAKYRYTRPLMFRRARDRYLNLPEVVEDDVILELNDHEQELYNDVLESVMANRHGMSSLEAFHSLRALQNVASTGQPLMPLMLRQRAPQDALDTWFHPQVRVPLAELPEDAECPICMNPLVADDATRTMCQHWFCRECIGNAMIRNNNCPLCRQLIDRGTVFMVDTTQQEEDCDMVIDLTEEPEEADAQPHVSTKIDRVTRDIQDIMESSEDDRILVFVESQIVLEAYGSYFEAVGIPYTSVHGGVSVTSRSRRLNSFQHDESCPYRVMLLTVKTSSAGITLTRANHILLVSPVIPRELEVQMIGRSHRLGQNQRVHFTRYIVEGTVEALLSRSSITTRQVPLFMYEYLRSQSVDNHI